MLRSALCALGCVILGSVAALGQTTAFSYQGQLTNTGQPANGSFDLQFALFEAASGGAQIGTTQTVSAVPVSNGVFTVQLDFGVSAFPGANRYLEIGVRPAGTGSYTTLAPRQQISATPYAIRTLSAASADALSSACVGCVTDAQIGSVAGSKVTGTIPAGSVPTGSGNYLQNTTAQQANANFNIAGNGTVGGNLTVNGTLNANVSGNFIQNRTTQQANANFNVSGNGTVGQLSANSVGIGTTSPASPFDVKGTGWFEGDSTPLQNTGSGVGIGFGPNGIPAGYVFAYDYGTGAPKNLLLNSPGGNVGVGTTAPVSRLDVNGTGWFEGNSAPLINASKGTAVGFLGAPYNAGYVFAYDYQASTPLNLLLNNSGGNVGIGTVTPASTLDVRATSLDGIHGASPSGNGVTGGSNTGFGVYGQTGAAHTASVSGVYGNSSGDGGVGVIGHADIGNAWGVLGTSSSPTGVGVYGSAVGYAMYANGNTGQARDKGGWVKAMVSVDEGGNITRCYNSQPFDPGKLHCGFTSTAATSGFPGNWDINFGFQVDDRFWSVSPGIDSHNSVIAADSFAAGTVIRVVTFYPSQPSSGIDIGFTYAPFVLIVY